MKPNKDQKVRWLKRNETHYETKNVPPRSDPFGVQSPHFALWREAEEGREHCFMIIRPRAGHARSICVVPLSTPGTVHIKHCVFLLGVGPPTLLCHGRSGRPPSFLPRHRSSPMNVELEAAASLC